MKTTILKPVMTVLVALFSLNANAYDAQVNGIYYNLNTTQKTAKVTTPPNGNKYSGTISIPASIVYNGVQYSVTEIEDYAFWYAQNLTSLTISKNVKNIGSDAIRGCSRLSSIVVDAGNSVYDSRSNCNALIKKSNNTLIIGCHNSIIPNSVTSIEEYAFNGLNNLTTITIPSNVQSIGMYAFCDCKNLRTITINSNSVVSKSNNNLTRIFGSQTKEYILGESVEGIGDNAFNGDKGLSSITISKNVKSIGSFVFSGCTNLTSITLDNSNKLFNNRYDNSDSFKAVFGEQVTNCIIGKSITTIADYTFNGCDNLRSVIIPNNITSIGNGAFYGCSGLTALTIPNSVTEIGYNSFCSCSGLTAISIPNSVTSIGFSAFLYCSGLNSVTISNNVTEIGSSVFEGCNNIKSLTIPSGVTSIGYSAFQNCSGLTTITIPNSVTSIGRLAFSGCSGLTSITIPNGVTSIGSQAFYNCI